MCACFALPTARKLFISSGVFLFRARVGCRGSLCVWSSDVSCYTTAMCVCVCMYIYVCVCACECVCEWRVRASVWFGSIHLGSLSRCNIVSREFWHFYWIFFPQFFDKNVFFESIFILRLATKRRTCFAVFSSKWTRQYFTFTNNVGCQFPNTASEWIICYYILPCFVPVTDAAWKTLA